MREEFADAVLEHTITQTVQKQEREASLKEGFDEMPSHEVFSTQEPSKVRSWAQWLVSAAPGLLALTAYVWAQATVRGIDTMADFTRHVQTISLESPQLVLSLLRNGLRASVGNQLPPMPTAAELLNVFGGTAVLLYMHGLMRIVLVRLVQRARQTLTIFDDVVFGIFLIMFPRAHVIFDPSELEASSATGRRGASRSEQLPLTLRFASVGDDTVRRHTACHFQSQLVWCMCGSWTVYVVFRSD